MNKSGAVLGFLVLALKNKACAGRRVLKVGKQQNSLVWSNNLQKLSLLIPIY